MKKFFKEFAEFAYKGNAFELAVGVITGAAFQSIVNSLVKDIISPIIGLFINRNFDDVVFKIKDVEIRYGAFITSIINFIILMFIIFLMVKGVNALNKKLEMITHKEKEEAKTTKICPYCKMEINIEATKCPHCTSDLK